MALDTPCIAVNALEALAQGVLTDSTVCPIRDARVKQVYGGVFGQGERLMEDNIWKLDDFLQAIRPLGESFLFIGDGVPVYREYIQSVLGKSAQFAPPHLNELKAGAAARIASLRRDEAHSHQELLPLYLRAPQAERERLKRENNG